MARQTGQLCGQSRRERVKGLGERPKSRLLSHLKARMNGAEVEKKALKLGYMPLSDCLPLLVAQQQ